MDNSKPVLSHAAAVRLRARGKQIAILVLAILAAYGLMAYVIVPSLWSGYDRRYPWLADAPDVTHIRDGHPGDPLNVALIGDEDQVKEIMNAAGQFGSKRVGFADWKNFWGGKTDSQSAGPNAVIWRGLPAADRPFHTHSATDYALDVRTPNNAPVGGASDKSDAGAVLGYLPSVPE